jgi:hypothetical protein
MTYNGQTLEKGEVFELAYLRNDQKLLAHGLVSEVEDAVPVQCGPCTKVFIDEAHRELHQRMVRHDREPVLVGKAQPKGRGKLNLKEAEKANPKEPDEQEVGLPPHLVEAAERIRPGSKRATRIRL